MSTDLCKVLATEHVEYIQNSGHFFAQLGDYYDCVDLPYNSTYFMANFINNRTSNPAQIFYGFCLPTECSPDFIEDVMNTELARANPILQAMLGFPLAVGSIDVNPQDKQYPFSGWFYLTVVLLVLLGLMGIIAAVKGLLTNK